MRACGLSTSVVHQFVLWFCVISTVKTFPRLAQEKNAPCAYIEHTTCFFMVAEHDGMEMEPEQLEQHQHHSIAANVEQRLEERW